MENKQRKIQDLVSRIPYKPCISVKINDTTWESFVLVGFDEINLICKTLEYRANRTRSFNAYFHDFKLFLRPTSSMTEEEEIEYDATFVDVIVNGRHETTMTYKSFDFLNSKHFDYRGLIRDGLADTANYPFLRAYGYNC